MGADMSFRGYWELKNEKGVVFYLAYMQVSFIT